MGKHTSVIRQQASINFCILKTEVISSDRVSPVTQPGDAAAQSTQSLEKISRIDLQLETTTRLAKMIAGAVPGSRLPTERELCEQLGVGRSTLREALRALSFVGAIETRQGAGTFVARPNEQAADRLFGLSLMLQRVKVKEVIEARRSLEVDVARIAAQRCTELDRQALTEILDSMRESARSTGFGKPADYDLQFHVALARATQNSVLVHLINGMRSLLVIWMNKAVNAPEVAEKAVREHSRILNAVFSGDSEKAAAFMNTHLTNAAKRVLSVVGLDQSTADYMEFLLAGSSQRL